MRLRDIVTELGLRLHAGEGRLDVDVGGGFAGDLMSDAIARAAAGSVWVTVQTHANVVAIAMMKELAGVIVCGGKQPEADALERARREGVPLLSSELSSFEIVGRLFTLGVSGRIRDAGGL